MSEASPIQRAESASGEGADPYTVRAGEARPAPPTLRRRLTHLGPSVIVSGSIVGSGEIILTASLGATIGFLLLWWVLVSCWSKSLVQAELSRYVVVSGDTYLRALNRRPGRLPGPRGPIAWPIWLGLIALGPGVLGLGGIFGGAGQALELLVPRGDRPAPARAAGGGSGGSDGREHRHLGRTPDPAPPAHGRAAAVRGRRQSRSLRAFSRWYATRASRVARSIGLVA